MKSIITKLLLGIASLLCLPISASAFDFEVDGIYYTILSDSEGTCAVSKGYSEYVGDVVIPSTVTFENHAYSVTSIGTAFKSNIYVTSVTIPNSVSGSLIGAFIGCFSLAEISVAQDNPEYCSIDGVLFNKDCTTLIAYPNAKGSEYTVPDSVTLIEYQAFCLCNNLTSVTISDSVTWIGDEAFFRCTSLASVNFGKSIEGIGRWAFFECKSIYSITIPNSVTVIRDGAFSSCWDLTELTIGDSVIAIGEGAFSGCTSLASLTIGNSINVIGRASFDNCTALKTVAIPESVTEIGEAAFNGCTSMTNVSIGNYVSNIGLAAFAYCSSLVEISVAADNPNYCSIGGVLFNKDCTELIAYPNAKSSEYIIPDSVTSIAQVAFVGCNSLTNITIPNSVTNIGMDAFLQCYSLTNVTIPESVTECKSSIFCSCKSLTSLTIPGNVKEIGNFAFADCENLTSVYYNCEDPIEIDDDSIFASSLEKSSLYVPETAVDKCLITPPWKYFKNIVAYDFSGVETVSEDAVKSVTGRYGISGAPVDENYQGPVIVTFSDGTTQKTLQK